MKFRDSLDILTKRNIPVPTGNGVRDESFPCVVVVVVVFVAIVVVAATAVED
jgi:hypothetical protein